MESTFAVGCHTLQLIQHWEAERKYNTHFNQIGLHFRNHKSTQSHEKKEDEKNKTTFIYETGRNKTKKSFYTHNNYVQFYSWLPVNLSLSTLVLSKHITLHVSLAFRRHLKPESLSLISDLFLLPQTCVDITHFSKYLYNDLEAPVFRKSAVFLRNYQAVTSEIESKIRRFS